jgi:hypothetical protein
VFEMRIGEQQDEETMGVEQVADVVVVVVRVSTLAGASALSGAPTRESPHRAV